MANKHGGGAKTNANGLRFEQDTSLNTALINAGYRIQEEEVFSGNKSIGFSVPQHKLYSKFLEPNGIHYSDYNSKKWLPDECFINKEEKIAYIIEKKFQKIRIFIERLFYFGGFFHEKAFSAPAAVSSPSSGALRLRRGHFAGKK